MLVLFTTVNLFAQNRSINFVECSFNEAIELSKKGDKPLFVDCYTSWCGPCKMMAKDVFTNDAVADYFNENFICIKFDCEKGEGPRVASTYQVSGYPTFLIIDTNKQLIHKMVGGTSAERFIENTKKGLDPEFSTYGKRKKFESGNYDKKFLMTYFTDLVGINDSKNAKEVGNKILSMTDKSELFTLEMWKVVRYYFVSGYGSEWWNFILDNSDKYIEVVGKKEFNSKLSETMHPYLFGFVTGSRTADNAEYKSYKELIEKYDLENKELLLHFWRLGDSRLNDNFNGFFKTVIKEYKTMDLSEHFRIMTNILDHLAKNVNPKQKEQLLATIKESELRQNDYMKETYQKLYEKLK